MSITFDVGQVCLNGHIINGDCTQYPAWSSDYCTKCGAKTITKCPNCTVFIRGNLIGGIGSKKTPESYCYKCGKPYPWTEDKINATKELLELEESISSKELEYLTTNINSIMVDTPKTKVVATKFKLFLNKSGKEVASGIRDILVDIASETAKKIIFPESK